MFGLPSAYLVMAKAAFAAVLIAILMGYGYHLGSSSMEAEKDKQIMSINQAYYKTVSDATHARDEANEHAREVEQHSVQALAANDAAHVEALAVEQSKTAALVDAYSTGAQRMRVRIAAPAADSCRSAVPGAAAPASGGDGQATAELSGAAAAGIAAVAGRANDIVHQLELAQETLTLYYAQCGPQAQR